MTAVGPMQFISDFADQAVVLPLAMVVALALGVVGWWRGLVAWTLSAGTTMALVVVMKVAGLALTDDFGQSSISGHVAAGSMVYAGLTVMLTGSARLGVMVYAVVAAAIGATRIELLAHDWLEVVCGALLGGVGLALLIAGAGRRPHLPNWPVAAAAACTVLALHGMHMPAELALRSAFTAR